MAKGEFFYQLGKTIKSVDVKAYFANAEAGYHLGKLYFGAGIDYLSGQNPNVDRNEEFQAFDLLYGTRYKFYGNMNFITTPASSRYGGFVNTFLKIDTKFNKKNKLSVTYNMFKTAQKVSDTENPGQFYDQHLGSELDFIYSYKLSKDIGLNTGYHIAFPTATMEIFKGLQPGESETPQWFWLMLTIKPTLFSSK